MLSSYVAKTGYIQGNNIWLVSQILYIIKFENKIQGKLSVVVQQNELEITFYTYWIPFSINSWKRMLSMYSQPFLKINNYNKNWRFLMEYGRDNPEYKVSIFQTDKITINKCKLS